MANYQFVRETKQKTTAVPTGPAGGDLIGVYPNPSLSNYGPGITGPIGNGTTVPIITIDSKGRVSALTYTTISGTSPGGLASGDLTGSYPNPTIKNSAITPTKTDLTQTWNFSGLLQSGSQNVVVTTDSRLSDSRLTSGSAGGDLTGSYPNPTIKNSAITPTKTDLTQTWNFSGLLQSGSQNVVVSNDNRLLPAPSVYGQVVYDSGSAYKSAPLLHWDNTNKMLGIGVTASVAPLHVYQPTLFSRMASFSTLYTGNLSEIFGFGATSNAGFPEPTMYVAALRLDCGFTPKFRMLADAAGIYFQNTNNSTIKFSGLNGGLNTLNLFHSYYNEFIGQSFFGAEGITPTAWVHLAASPGVATSAPLKFTHGTLLGTPEVGAVEFRTDSFYATITTGVARKEIALSDSTLISGNTVYATTNGRLTTAAPSGAPSSYSRQFLLMGG